MYLCIYVLCMCLFMFMNAHMYLQMHVLVCVCVHCSPLLLFDYSSNAEPLLDLGIFAPSLIFMTSLHQPLLELG